MKMPERIDAGLFAPCGMNCMVCYKHCAHKKPCAGCLVNDQGKPGHCRACAIKACVEEKGFTYCFACARYPCKRIKALDKSYRSRYGVSLLENSRAVAEAGLAAFQEQQRAVYACPACGGVISLHDAQCSECGAKSR